MAYNPGTRQQVSLDFAHLVATANKQMLVLSMSPQADPYAGAIYVVEARKRTGTYETKLAGDAVIIHKVEASGTAYSVDADVPAADTSNNEGSMFKVGERWLTPEGTHVVTITAQTATGFLLTVGPPRMMSSPNPPRLKPSGTSASSAPATTGRQAPPTPARTPAPARAAATGGARREGCAARERCPVGDLPTSPSCAVEPFPDLHRSSEHPQRECGF